jgi:hypothetical protein
MMDDGGRKKKKQKQKAKEKRKGSESFYAVGATRDAVTLVTVRFRV